MQVAAAAGACPVFLVGARAATIFVVMPKMAVIRRLAWRPLDTLLATWGFSPIPVTGGAAC